MFKLTKFRTKRSCWLTRERSACGFHRTWNQPGIWIFHVRIERDPAVCRSISVIVASGIAEKCSSQMKYRWKWLSQEICVFAHFGHFWSDCDFHFPCPVKTLFWGTYSWNISGGNWETTVIVIETECIATIKQPFFYGDWRSTRIAVSLPWWWPCLWLLTPIPFQRPQNNREALLIAAP